MRCPPGQADRPEVHRSPSVPFFLYPDVQWAFPRLRDVVEDLARFRPDVVHVATEFSLGIAGLKAARQLGLPFIASAHTDYEQYAARYGVPWALRAGWHYLRWFYGQAHRVLCPSRIYEEHLHSRGVTHTGTLEPGRGPRVVPSPLPERGVPGALRGRARRPAGHLHRPDRAGEEPRAAARGLGAAGTGARLGPAGAGGRGPLEEEIRRREIPGVHVPGLLQGRELSAAYASADIFAFPSPTETFGNSLLEAMGSGLPSLVAASGGVLEFAEHGGNAWLVAPDSAAGDRGRSEPAADRRGAAPPPAEGALAYRAGARLGSGVRPAARGLSGGGAKAKRLTRAA